MWPNIFTLLPLRLLILFLIFSWSILKPTYAAERKKCTPVFEKHCLLKDVVDLLGQHPPELNQESLIALVTIASEILPSHYLRKETWPYDIDISGVKILSNRKQKDFSFLKHGNFLKKNWGAKIHAS